MTTTTPPPYVTTVGLARSLNSGLLERPSIVDTLRRYRENPPPFNPWSKLYGGIRADLRFGTANTNLLRAINQPPAKFGGRYRALGEAWMEYRGMHPDSAGWREAKVHDAIVICGGLTIKLNPPLGIAYADGQIEAVHLWLDEIPLAEQSALVLLDLMQTQTDIIRLGATPCVIDVLCRRAYRLPARWSHRDHAAAQRSLESQAAAIVALWGGNAAAAA
jgi:hypothetical protein